MQNATTIIIGQGVDSVTIHPNLGPVKIGIRIGKPGRLFLSTNDR